MTITQQLKPDVKHLGKAVVVTILLASTIWSHAQRGTLTTVQSAPTVSIFSLPKAAVIAPFKQIVLTWDNPPGASNRVAWGGARYSWTNSVAVSTNLFNVTNGTHYAVYATLNGVESIPALWPSNRLDRVWIQTSTNLTNWKDGFIWKTNMNLPQEFLRIRAELIRWE